MFFYYRTTINDHRFGVQQLLCYFFLYCTKKKQAYFGLQFWSFEPMLKQQFDIEVSQGTKPFISWSGSKTEEEERGLEAATVTPWKTLRAASPVTALCDSLLAVFRTWRSSGP